MSLSEVSSYLRQPVLSPKTVGLIARGPDGTDMQALAAQGISLRTPGVPKFSVIARNTDFNVIMAKRDRLFDITDDPMILNSKGPRIFVPRGRPTELIFTADTDAEIVQMLEVFATRKLPGTRRSISSTTDALEDNSRLRVALNGKTLGAAKLDKKRKSVAFDIQPGALNATSNILTLVPDLDAKPGYSCPVVSSVDTGFSIGRSSTGDNLLQTSYGQSASAGSDEAVLKYAAAQSAPLKINRGGVAALYTTGNGKLTGVISSAPGSSFIQASRSLVEPAHWNALQGGVARWTSSSVVMAQIAQSDAGIAKPKRQSLSKFRDFDIWSFDDLDLHWPDELPEINWPEINWPEFDMPQVGLPNLKWPNFKSADALEPITPVAVKREVSLQKTETARLETFSQSETRKIEKIGKVAEIAPRLKPSLNRPVDTAASLRGPFEFTFEEPKRFGSFEDIRRGTKAKWSDLKRWVKGKTKTVSDMRTFDDMAQATDRLQDQVKPAGRSIKSNLKDKLPGKALVQLGDRTVSVYGLILILAFGLVLLLMSLSRPTSRLGGRH